jgi:endonuclease YncB( thermonuclease family)
MVGYAQTSDRWFKVWPLDGDLRRPNGHTTGKLWFDRQFARVELVEAGWA